MPGNKIVIINGPNINMLANRESIYPNISYEQLKTSINDKFSDINLVWLQSNYEGQIIDWIQSLLKDDSVVGLIINPGGYCHYSVSILDALKLLNKIKVEVHFTNIHNREDYRNQSITANGVDQVFMGYGIYSYIYAINYILENTTKNIN